jgi:homoserine O-acetyltransferase
MFRVGGLPSLAQAKPLDSDRIFHHLPECNRRMSGEHWSLIPGAGWKRWGSRFPSITIRDMVAAELALTDLLGIKSYFLAVGPSLGGMRALEWAIAHPDRVQAICTIGSSAVATGDQIGAASIQIRAIKSDPFFNAGDYYEQVVGPHEGMGIARRIAHLTYRTESEMDVRFGRELQGDETGRYAVESYLDHQAQS